MKIIEHRKFASTFKKADLFVKRKVRDAIATFLQDPFDTLLENHALKGKRLGYRTINATGDYRIVFKELSNGKYELVELIDIGTHSQLYG